MLGHKVVGSSKNNLVESAAGEASMPVTPVQRGSLTFFCARLSDTLNRKRNGFYLHTVPGKLLALTLY